MSEPVSPPLELDGDAPVADGSRRKLLFGLLAGGVALVLGAIAYLTLTGGGGTPVAVSLPPLIPPSSASPSTSPPPSLVPATGRPVDPFKALYRDTTVGGTGSPTTGTGTGDTGGSGGGDTGGSGGGDTGSVGGDTGGLGGGDTGSGGGDGGTGSTQSGVTVGQFCSPMGATGRTVAGQTVTCEMVPGDLFLRWRSKATSASPSPSHSHSPTHTAAASITPPATPTTSATPTHTVSPPPPPPSGPVLPVAGKLVVYRPGSRVPADCTSLPAYRVQVKDIAGVVLRTATLAAGVPSRRPHGPGYRCTYAYTLPLAKPLQAFYIFSAGPATGTGDTSNFVVADVLVQGGHGPDLKLGD